MRVSSSRRVQQRELVLQLGEQSVEGPGVDRVGVAVAHGRDAHQRLQLRHGLVGRRIGHGASLAQPVGRA